MKGKWLLFGGSAVLIAAAAGALLWWRNQPNPEPAKPPTRIETANPPPKTGFFGNEVSLTGIVQPQKTIGVPPPVDGVIQEILVEPGSPVFQGQLLARIKNGKLDTTLESATADVEKLKTKVANLDGQITSIRLESARAQADALRAKAELERADKAYTRQSLLYKEGATPRLTYEKAGREFKEAQTASDNLAEVAKSTQAKGDTLSEELDGARKLLDQKTGDLESARQGVASGDVQSPIDGVVISFKGQPGEAISRATGDFIQLSADAAALQILADADPAVLPRIKEGQQAAIIADEAPQPIPGVVKEIKGSQVRVDFISPTPEIKPGLTARVTIKLQ